MGDQSTGGGGGGDGGGEKRRPKPGILRLDISKPRRSSGGSVEFRSQPELLGEAISPSFSGTASPQQLSVTWATQCEDPNSPDSKQMQNYLKSPQERSRRKQQGEDRTELSPDPASPLDATEGNNSEDEDYSLSVSAIMQRRASIRGHRKKSRSSRRMSSPMDHVLEAGGDRRRSSVYTTSSGDTAISLDDGTNQDSTQEQIYENIRLHKEVIQSVKYQPWSMRRKLKLVRQAKVYVARHEGALQERFAMSRSTRDLWARFKIVMAARWRHWKREIYSYLTVLIPWELRIKQIESHFGSGVASYFTFLRWLLWVNIMIAIPLCAFVIIPELLATDPDIYDKRKKMTKSELKIAGNILTIWEFGGYLKYSPMFYGFYSHFSGAVRWGYNLPLAYFLTCVAVYIYSFVAILKKMAENSRLSKLSLKDDECVFSWKLFTGWDFMIGHAETAHNRIASVVVGFKEALLEEAEKKKDKRNWRIILQRILVNILIIGLLVASGYTIVIAVDSLAEDSTSGASAWRRHNLFLFSDGSQPSVNPSTLDQPVRVEALGGALAQHWLRCFLLMLIRYAGSENAGPNANWLRRNELNIIMTLLSFFLPMMFEAVGLFENWHPRQQLRLQLARIMILNLLNLYSLMFSFMYSITGKEESYMQLKDTAKNAREQVKYLEGVLNNITTRFAAATSTSFLNAVDNETESSLFSDNATDWNTPIFSESPTTLDIENQTICTTIFLNCSRTRSLSNKTLTTSLLLLNLSTTVIPDFWYKIPEYSTGLSSFDDVDSMHLNDSYFDYFDYFENFPDDSFDGAAQGPLGGYAASKRNRDIREAKNTEIESKAEFPNNQEANNVFRGIYDASGLRGLTQDNIEDGEGSVNITQDFSEVLPRSLSRFNTTADGANKKGPWDEGSNNNLAALTLNDSILVTEMFENDLYDGEDGDNCTRVVCVTIPDASGTSPFSSEDDRSTQSLEMSTSEPSIDYSLLAKLDDDKKFYEEALRNVSSELKEVQKNLSAMCWETSLGQELSKVIVFDTIMSIAAPLCIDFLRALFVRYVNDYWCWDMEKTFPQYGDFKIAESILNLVYNQGQVWMGIFFSPGLVIINIVKLIILMYLRSWIVLTCNVPHELVFKASKSNNFYLSLLLTMLFLCVLPVGYAVVWLRPSSRCGPFSKYERISQFFTNTTIEALPPSLHKPLEYMTSSSTVIPLLLLLILIIYYLISLTGALREANQDLRNQLQKERMEERRKMFKPEEKPAEDNAAGISARWKKVLEASSPITPTGPGAVQHQQDLEDTKMQARKELLAKIMKRALRKGSGTSDDETTPNRYHEDDETDNEYHDSLPHDEESGNKMHKLSKNGRRVRKPSIIDIIQLAKKERLKETHPNERFKVDKEVPDFAECDPETNLRIVSERRKSLLKRQDKVRDFSTPEIPEDISINYELVNEKGKDLDKPSLQQPSPTPSVEPKRFKFDAQSVENEHPEGFKKRFSTNMFFKRSISAEPEREPSRETAPQQTTLTKSKKKLGSFLALVKEAVNTKKSEEDLTAIKNNDEPKTPDTTKGFTEERQNEIVPAKTPPKAVEEETKVVEASSVESKISSRPGSQRKLIKHQPVKKDDSSSSLWSDSIPVITISKTGSQECILECNDADSNGNQKKEPPENKSK